MAGVSQQQLRVGVVGGGLAGCLSALILRSRGLHPTVFDQGTRGPGGRFGGGQSPDSGAQFMRPSQTTSQFVDVLAMLEREGLMSRWSGRFGILGSRGGGFLPTEVLAKTNMNSMLKEAQEDDISCTDGTDFCGFLASHGPLYTGIPANASVCEGICSAAGIELRRGLSVVDASMKSGRWTLNTGASKEFECDALVLATHDPSFAANLLRNLPADSNAPPAFTEQLQGLISDLDVQRAEHTEPVFTWRGYFSPGLSASVPFDAVTVPGSQSVRFLAREASKPGRPKTVPFPRAQAGTASAEAEAWTAVSTSSFARDVLARASGREESTRIATHMLSIEVAKLLAPFFGGAVHLPPQAEAKRWSLGLSSRTLRMEKDCIALPPFKLAICGDFIREHGTPVEAAAISGIEAGEIISTMLAAHSGKV